MRQQFNPRRNTNRRFQPAKKDNTELVRAIRSVQLVGKPTTDSPVPVAPLTHYTFNDFPIIDQLKANIAAKKYGEPTPIQDQAIFPILQGRDVIGIANTGTGKTAAFLIPLIDKVFKNKGEKVLIVTPTRELAVQIQEELRDFARGLNIYSVLCVGGLSRGRQKNELQRNPSFVIGTPGRIKDLTQDRSLNLSYFHSVVLDEADRMVDIGFINDIKYFISLLPSVRQSLFFSATIDQKVQGILQSFVVNPVTVSVKQKETAANIDQDVIQVVDKARKVDQLHDLLVQRGFDKVLIFGRTKWGIQKLTNELVKRGFKAGVIHGNKRQSQRQKTLDQFKRNEISILLATDVASRGLDIQGVSHVINYDMPATMDDYVHRIGRTGRAGKLGTALTFVD